MKCKNVIIVVILFIPLSYVFIHPQSAFLLRYIFITHLRIFYYVFLITLLSTTYDNIELLEDKQNISFVIY